MKKALVSFLLLLSGVVASAQMTEDKIYQYVQEQQAKGVSQEQIVYELSRKGVTLQQLQRMREKYEKLQNTGVLGNTMPVQSSQVSRSREGAQPINQVAPEAGTYSSRSQDAQTREKERLQSYYDESMFLFVDSLFVPIPERDLRP